MRIDSLARPLVLSQPVYQPGKPIEYVARELGLDPAGIIKLASNENPFGPSPRAVEAATRALAQGALYPDGGCFELRRRLASLHGLGPDQFVVGNGSNELIELLGHVFLGPGDEVVMANPAFVVYKLVTLLFGATPVEVPLRDWTHDLAAMAAAVTPRTKLVCVCSPNNPTGTANSGQELESFVRSLPEHVVVVIDEAYAEYLENPPDLKPLIREGRNLICLRTFSKIHGLASLRVGYGYAGSELCGLLNRVRQPFNVNAIGRRRRWRRWTIANSRIDAGASTSRGWSNYDPAWLNLASSLCRAWLIFSWSRWRTVPTAFRPFNKAASLSAQWSPMASRIGCGYRWAPAGRISRCWTVSRLPLNSAWIGGCPSFLIKLSWTSG
jgi:histidinol-phosphate aminotransferase